MSKFEPSGGIEIIKDNHMSHYFTVEDELTYEPFFADFGPLNLGHVYSYCRFLDQKIKDESLAKKKIYHYSSVDGAKQTNAVFLIGAYCVLVLRWTAEAVLRIFEQATAPVGSPSSGGAHSSSFLSNLIPFRDASVGPSTFGLTVLDCWKSLIKANNCGFFDLDSFDPNEYYFYERVENGDMNWIVPGKFLAFSGPHASHHSDAGLRTLTPDDYIPYFKKHNVVMVVRLNKKVYDKKRFIDYGVKHTDLYFVDGSTPSDSIVQRFLEVVEAETSSGGAIAVHCKAGLGRTGTLIGCSLMKHYKFTAQEAIAWLRISRPGSVIGPQQHFLIQIQSTIWKEGDFYRKKHQQSDHGKSVKVQRTLQNDYTMYDSTPSAPLPANGNSSSNEPPTKYPFSTTTNMRTMGSSTESHTSKGTQPCESTTSTSERVAMPNSLTSGSPSPPQNINTKERLKADMRLITATLKSMRTTPPTTPNYNQDPYFNSFPSATHPPTDVGAQLATSGSHSSMSSASGVSGSSSLYLNSPYAAHSTARPHKSASNPSTAFPAPNKGKSPSGLSLQHRKIENQANRPNHNPIATVQASSPSSSRHSSAKSITVTSKPSTRVPYERHTSPTLSRSLFSATASTVTSQFTSNSSPSNPGSTSTHPGPKSVHRKSSGNLLATYNPPSSSSNNTPSLPSSTGSRSAVDFKPSITPTRSISNTSPSAYYSSYSLQPPSAVVLSRSKTPPPPRRHTSATRSMSILINSSIQLYICGLPGSYSYSYLHRSIEFDL